MEQLGRFVADQADYRLNSHPLVREWAGYRSIDITGDIRAIYKKEAERVVRFVAIGSHSQLYE